MIRTRAAIALVAALLAAVALGCGGDDDGGGTTTTTTEQGAEGSAPDDDTDPDGTDPGGSDDPAGDDPATTAGDDPAPVDGGDEALRALLADPAEVGEGYAVDPTLGDGTFEVDLCEDVTLDATWESSGSQALSAGTGGGTVIYSESVLAFADEGAAGDFVTAAADGYLTCLPEMVRSEPDVGDEAVLLRNDDLISTQAYAFVRVGARVAALRASTDPDGDLPVDDDLLAGVASRLAG